MIYILNMKLIKEVISMGKAYIRLPLDALLDARLHKSSVTVLAMIIDKSDSGCCNMSVEQLAERTAMGIRTVSRAIKELEDTGYITVLRRAGERNKYIHNDVLPKKKGRSQSAPDGSEYNKEDVDKLLEQWADMGVLERIGGKQ